MSTIAQVIDTLQNLTNAKVNQSDIARALNKRLQFLPPNTVAVISDNPKYKTFEVDLSKELDYDFAVIFAYLNPAKVAEK